MPNANYQAGRRFEYETMKRWKDKGYNVLRTAGSHGEFDVIAYSPKFLTVTFIQCKVVASNATANRLIKAFREKAPAIAYSQVMEVKVKGSTKILSSWYNS